MGATEVDTTITILSVQSIDGVRPNLCGTGTAA